jgi:hypothetical protein
LSANGGCQEQGAASGSEEMAMGCGFWFHYLEQIFFFVWCLSTDVNTWIDREGGILDFKF